MEAPLQVGKVSRSQTGVKDTSAEVVWSTSEQEYQLWKNQGQCLINLGLLLFIQSSLCSDQNCGILRELSPIRAVGDLLIRICPTKEEALMVPFLKRVKDNAYL